jgi:hypothetical protein
MARTNVMLALIVSKVLLSWVPTESIHILGFPNPKITHLHGTQLLAFYGVIPIPTVVTLSQWTGVLGWDIPYQPVFV